MNPCVCTAVRKASRALMRRYEAALDVCDISVTQFALLRALERHGAIALTDLARVMVMERTSLYRSLDPLVQQGFVDVSAASEGRTKIASLMPAGREQIAKVLPHWERAQRQVEALIGEQHWAQISTLLLAIPDLLETTP